MEQLERYVLIKQLHQDIYSLVEISEEGIFNRTLLQFDDYEKGKVVLDMLNSGDMIIKE